jgi:hypothetical protein
MDMSTYTGFNGHQRIASGSLKAVMIAAKHVLDKGSSGQVLIFDDNTGKIADVDLRGLEQQMLARLDQFGVGNSQPVVEVDDDSSTPRGRGRPKLGVVAREVTLLPRHWDWLAAQPGGTSVALRKLVEEARRTQDGKSSRRMAQDRAYYFMSAIAGDLPNFEEASRALFANDQKRLTHLIAEWPEDVRDYTFQLAFGDDTSTSTK